MTGIGGFVSSHLKPLKDYRVVDFGHYVAGPAAGMMLADFGAEVVSVVPKGGPRWNHPVSRILARNKHVVEIDLKDPEGLESVRRLVERADVLIENFRPGVMDRLGLSYASFKAVNPGLVYLSLPGFASTDGERAHLRAFEAIISAASGQFTDMGLNRVLMGINPSFSPLTLASAYGAALGTNAIIYALFNRGRTGLGDRIEVPLASALMEGLAYNSQRVENYPERYKSPREKEIERREANGLPLNMAYDALQEFLDPFYRSYPCSDGRMIYIVCASHTAHSRRALEVLGLWDEIRALGIPEQDDWYRPMSEWQEDCALGHYPLSQKWADIVSKRMAEAFATDTAFAWEQKLGDGRVPARAHRTTQEWLHTEHAVQSGLVVEAEDTELGHVRSFGPLAWLRDAALDSPPAVQGKPTSITDALDGWPDKKSAAPKDTGSGLWLDGVKVLDMTNVIAGPTIASFLSRFGPEIIKLDPVKSTFDPWNTIVFGMQAGRGKQSVLADITTPEGREIFERLLKWADIITFNGTDRQVAGLGMDEDALQRINPDAILCQVDAFGGPRRGAMSDHPGYDDTVQAMTGVMIRFGGGRDTPEEHAHFGTIDVLGGYMAACAAGAALVMRMDQKRSLRARASLAAAGQLIQAPFMYDHVGRPPFNEPSGRDVLGAWAGYRFYRAKDNWFFLACAGQDELDVAMRAMDLSPAASDCDNAELLEQVIGKKTAAEWIGILTKLDVGAVIPASIADLRDRYLQHADDGSHMETGTYRFARHNIAGAGRWVDLFEPCAIRPETGAIRTYPPAEKYGASTKSVLRALGFNDGRISSLMTRGVVSDSWCEFYLPD